MSLRQIAEELGCSADTVRNDIFSYMSKLDTACLESVSAMRAEMAEQYDTLISQLSLEVEAGNIESAEPLLKAMRDLRKLYALDVQPLGRSELQLRRAVVTEIASKLRDRLTPELFAQVATCLVEDEPIRLLDGVAIASPDEERAASPFAQRTGFGA